VRGAERRPARVRLQELWEKAQELAGRVANVRYAVVRRGHNELADRLVNEALDAAGS
jgi:ribonuclease HI